MPTEPLPPLRAGAHWLEFSTGRRLRIIDPFGGQAGPTWTYVDSWGRRVPDSEREPNWYVHDSDIFDFSVWNLFASEDRMRILDTTPIDILPPDEIGDDRVLFRISGYSRHTGIAVAEVVMASDLVYTNGWRPFLLGDMLVSDPDEAAAMVYRLVRQKLVRELSGGSFIVSKKLIQALKDNNYWDPFDPDKEQVDEGWTWVPSDNQE